MLPINTRISKQAGFTLIELLIGLVLITILALAISTAFDGSRSRAQALIDQMGAVASAMARQKNDTGCYLNSVEGLFNRNEGILAANNYCGQSFANTWNGPYLGRFETTEGKARLDTIADGATLEIVRNTTAGVYNGNQYVLKASQIPNDIIKNALQECIKTDIPPSSVANMTTKCDATLGDGGEVGDFYFTFDETR